MLIEFDELIKKLKCYKFSNEELFQMNALR